MLSPDDLRQRLQALEWVQRPNRRDRMLGVRAFPIEKPLGAPSGGAAGADLNRFREWVRAWEKVPAEWVVWETRTMTRVGRQRIPTRLVLKSFKALTEFLGRDVVEQSLEMERRLRALIDVDPTLKDVGIRNLDALLDLAADDFELLCVTLPQLKAGLGAGRHLRGLPLRSVHTKFVEQNLRLLEALADGLHGGVVDAGGLVQWLDCLPKETSWLLVRPLCDRTREAVGGHDFLRLSDLALSARPINCRAVLVVENEVPAFGLPNMPGVLAVSGTGGNIAWLCANWIRGLPVGYWGDIDSWGFHMAGLARAFTDQVQTILMDLQTLRQHPSRVVKEPVSTDVVTERLTAEEVACWRALRAEQGNMRLEQELLDADWVQQGLSRWFKGLADG